jgi:hypothetical protein
VQQGWLVSAVVPRDYRDYANLFSGFINRFRAEINIRNRDYVVLVLVPADDAWHYTVFSSDTMFRKRDYIVLDSELCSPKIFDNRFSFVLVCRHRIY